MKRTIVYRISGLLLMASLAGSAAAGGIKITPALEKFDLQHNGSSVTVQRNQDESAHADPFWSKTGRKCPPFCAQPITAAPGVQTVGIAEVAKFMKDKVAKGSGVLVDARTPDWYARGTIPGAVNIPFTTLNRKMRGTDATIGSAFDQFGVKKAGSGWDFSNAKEVTLWCNGWWCGQSPAAIRGMLKEGYPAEKIKYFRGGMQNWQIYGMTVVK